MISPASLFSHHFSPIRRAVRVLLTAAIALAPGWSASAQTSVQSPQAKVIRHSQVGVCTHFVFPSWDPEKIVPVLATSGVGWIRDDIAWSSIEKEKGVYKISDRNWKWINAVNAAGIKILAIFNYGNDLYAPDKYNPEAFAKAAAWFAKETAGKVQAIEILNEPYNFGFNKFYGSTSWNGMEPNGTVSKWVGKYVELLNTAAPAIKAVNPAVKVIGLGCAAPTNFRELEMGISPMVDGIADHPYSPRMSDENVPYSDCPAMLKRDGIITANAKGTFASQIKMYQERSAKFKGPKEMWLTEFGWSTFPEAKAGGLFAGFTQEAQAKYLLRRITESLALGVTAAFIYDLRDDGTDPYYMEHHFGLVDINLRPKPSYGAIQRYCAAMAECKPRENFEVNVFAVENRPERHPIIWDDAKIASSGRVKTYQFVNGKQQPVIAVWSSERVGGDLAPMLADIECVTALQPKTIRAYDPYSDETRTLTCVKKEGRLVLPKISIPDSPLILTLE